MATVDISGCDGTITIIACHDLHVPGLQRVLHATSGHRVFGYLLKKEDYML